MKTQTTKNCERCGQLYRKFPATGKTAWDKRRFCGQKCSSKSRWEK